jgi:hypothetical protein
MKLRHAIAGMVFCLMLAALIVGIDLGQLHYPDWTHGPIKVGIPTGRLAQDRNIIQKDQITLGWYLIAPPLMNNDPRQPLLNAPIRDWPVIRPFDTAEQCDAVRVLSL